jgi:phosphatidylglycerol:prolipoprotein diacylglycerol transferase
LIHITINPVAFTIGSLSVRWYGVMIALGVLVLVLWMLREVKKGARLSYDTVVTAALVGIPSGIIVSRLLYLIDRWVYAGSPGPIWGLEGLTIWGAVLGAALGVWIYSRLSKFPFGYFADLVVLPTILAQAIGRVGCTINGCCYGLPTTLPWGVVYTDPRSYGYAASLSLPQGMGLHPTQVYEIVFLLIIFGVLFPLRKRFQPEGSFFLIYLSLYSAWRLGIDFLRAGNSFLFGLHQAQVISIIVLLIAVPMLILRTRWVKGEGKG